MDLKYSKKGGTVLLSHLKGLDIGKDLVNCLRIQQEVLPV